MRAPATPFFRDVTMPSHRQDRIAHERFLLDTYADRKAPERKPITFRSVVARVAAIVR